ncbi:MAG: TIR domain-containing protein [Deltaproteobacteria bacterium]|nr:TIR domain-containing protein [Deltaproteobacteria bacterium]
MRVFISWSGERSRKVAKYFFKWIKKLPLSIDPWISKKAIDPGTRWEKELSEALDGTNFGILCITPENQHEPWICFEAGALSKSLEKSRVVPYLIDMSPADLEQPLKQFQAIEATREDTWRLIESIYNVSKDKTRTIEDLKEAFDKWWDDLANIIDHLKMVEMKDDDKTKELTINDIKITIDKILNITESMSSRLIKSGERIVFELNPFAEALILEAIDKKLSYLYDKLINYIIRDPSFDSKINELDFDVEPPEEITRFWKDTEKRTKIVKTEGT